MLRGSFVLVDHATLGENGAAGPRTLFLGALGWTGNRGDAVVFTRESDAEFYRDYQGKHYPRLVSGRKVSVIAHKTEGEGGEVTSLIRPKVTTDYDPHDPEVA